MSHDIPLELIERDPEQPRQHFDPAALGELAASLDASGLAVPILLRPVGDRFVLVHGERRWRAAGQINWPTIRAEVRDLEPDEARWLSLVENIQRADLSPIEEAQAYQARLAGGLTQEQLGERIGKGQSYIAQKLRLLTLPDPVRVFVECSALSEGHARQLLRLRGLYGEGLTATFAPGALEDWPSNMRRDLGDSRRTMLWFNLIRPLDQPVGGPTPKDEAETRLFTASVDRFLRYALDLNGTTPLWALGAYYYAGVAAYLHQSVADLARAIDAWYEHLLSAVGYWFVERNGEREHPKPPEDTAGNLLYWGYYADLKHARILAYAVDHGAPGGLIKHATVHMAKQGSMLLPTSLQVPGAARDRYTKLSDHPAAVL